MDSSWYQVGTTAIFFNEKMKFGNKGRCSQERDMIIVTSDALVKSSNGSTEYSENWVFYNQHAPRSLKNLEDNGWLIVVIDNGSVDRGKEIVGSLGLVNLMYIIPIDHPSILPFPSDIIRLFARFELEPSSRSIMVGTDGDKDERDYHVRGTGRSRMYADKLMVKYMPPECIYGRVVVPSLTARCQELIITVGQHGTGIHCFSRSLADMCGYVLVGDKEDKSLIDRALCEGRSVVVVGNHPIQSERETLMSLPKAMTVGGRIVWFTGDGREFSDTIFVDQSDSEREEYSRRFECPLLLDGFRLEVVD